MSSETTPTPEPPFDKPDPTTSQLIARNPPRLGQPLGLTGSPSGEGQGQDGPLGSPVKEGPSSPAQEVEMDLPDREIVASPDSIRSHEGSSGPSGPRNPHRSSNGHSIPSPLSSVTNFANMTPFPLRNPDMTSAPNAHARRLSGMSASAGPISPTHPTGIGLGSLPESSSNSSSRPNSMALRRISDSSAYSHLSGHHRAAPPSPAGSRRTSAVLGVTKEEDFLGLGLPSGSGQGQQTFRARSASKTSLGAGSSSGWSSSAVSRNGTNVQTSSGVGRTRPPSQLIPITGRDEDGRSSEGILSNTPSRVPSPVEEVPDLAVPPATSTSEGLLPIISPQSNSAQSIPSIYAPPIRLQVTVRDFGFPLTDERHHGRAIPSPLSATRSAASSDIEDYSGSPGGTSKGGRRKSSFGGWGGFSLGGFGWGSLRSNKNKRKSSGGSQEHGSRNLSAKGDGREKFGGTEIDTDLDLSSDMTPSSSYDLGNDSDGFLSSRAGGGDVGEGSTSPLRLTGQITPAYGEMEELVDDDQGAEADDELGPEPKGFYKVVYAFEAEGEPEMSVAEGEIIKVKGRGGGIGWVIGVRWTLNGAGEQVEGQEGLVPESYLDPVEEDL